MWILDNKTPFLAERTWVRDKHGQHHWIVIVKATWDIESDGRLHLSDQQCPPLHAPEYLESDGQSSLRYEADLTAMKPATDVYLNAIAYAPQARPTPTVEVAAQIESKRKILTVSGDRSWCQPVLGSWSMTRPAPFTRMPIIYERARGGYDPNPSRSVMDSANPVGRGVAADTRRLIGTPAPNVEFENPSIKKKNPAGFGAIASFWSPRKELAGTYDEAWHARQRPLLPLDFDPQHLLCAPHDQQFPGYLKGGECITLVNLTPSGYLSFHIPAVQFEFETYISGNRHTHKSELVSVIFDSEPQRLITVWQTSLLCVEDGEYLDVTVVRRKE